MATIEERVIFVVAEQLGISQDKVKLSSTVTQELAADSLDTVEIIMTLRNEFGRPFPAEEVEKLFTIKDIVAYISNVSPP